MLMSHSIVSCQSLSLSETPFEAYSTGLYSVQYCSISLEMTNGLLLLNQSAIPTQIPILKADPFINSLVVRIYDDTTSYSYSSYTVQLSTSLLHSTQTRLSIIFIVQYLHS